MFLIKQVAEDLGISTQAIYKQKAELLEKGYMIKNSADDYELTNEGYEYLKEKRVNKIKRKAKKLNSDNSKSNEKSMIIDTIWLNKKLTAMYEERINELQKQVDYFKGLYENEKEERKAITDKYQNFLISLFKDK